MGVTLAINNHARVQLRSRGLTIQPGSDTQWEGDKEIATPRTVESHFIHHNILHFGKTHSRYEIIRSSTVLSMQCVEYTLSFLQSQSRNETWLKIIIAGWICPVQQSQGSSRMFRTVKTIL